MKALGINNLIINPSATFKAQVKLNKMMVRDFKKLKPITGQKLTEGLPLRINANNKASPIKAKAERTNKVVIVKVFKE